MLLVIEHDVDPENGDGKPVLAVKEEAESLGDELHDCIAGAWPSSPELRLAHDLFIQNWRGPITIHRDATREEEVLHALGHRSLKHVERAPDVHIEQVRERERMSPACAIPVDREVIHDVHSLDGLVDEALVGHAALEGVGVHPHELEVRLAFPLQTPFVNVENPHEMALV